MTGRGDIFDVAGIAKGSAPVFDSVADVHNGGPQKPEFDLIFLQNPEVLACRDAGQNKKIDAVVMAVGDYLSI